LAESIVQGLAISVATFQGQVTLTGAVDTDEQKAKSVKGKGSFCWAILGSAIFGDRHRL